MREGRGDEFWWIGGEEVVFLGCKGGKRSGCGSG